MIFELYIYLFNTTSSSFCHIIKTRKETHHQECDITLSVDWSPLRLQWPTTRFETAAVIGAVGRNRASGKRALPTIFGEVTPASQKGPAVPTLAHSRVVRVWWCSVRYGIFHWTRVCSPKPWQQVTTTKAVKKLG